MPAPVRPGTVLNQTYQIEGLIAQGGMGEVYRGINIETRDPIAIKMIRQELSESAEVMSLFRREAAALHDVMHEAIVRYYLFSVDRGTGRAFMAMEYVDGPSLSKYLERGPMTQYEVDVIRTRVGLALDAVHRRGIVHRDISSDNFILSDSEVAKIKLIDFGIARLQRPGEGTIIGAGFAGKYAYASPEQLNGHQASYKSDIYSFGLVLAEALRGRQIDMGGSQVDMVEKRRRVPDLSDIPAPFRPLLTAMLQPDPEMRPNSLAEVANWRLVGADMSEPAASPPPLPDGRTIEPIDPTPARSQNNRVKVVRPQPISFTQGSPKAPVQPAKTGASGPSPPKPSRPEPRSPLAAAAQPPVNPQTAPLRAARSEYLPKLALNGLLSMVVFALWAILGAGSFGAKSLVVLGLLFGGAAVVSAVNSKNAAGAALSYALIPLLGLGVGLYMSLIDAQPMSQLSAYLEAGVALAIVIGFIVQSVSLIAQFAATTFSGARAKNPRPQAGREAV